MTMNEARIAREWASKALGNDLLAEVPIEGYRAAARYILATTTPPTMADIAWDDEVHAGLCAESTDDGVVRMIGPDWVNDHADHILCRLLPGGIDSLPMSSLTPLPGTRVDLTPRREQEPEVASEHPKVLTTAAEYLHAPAGTLVAAEGEEAWTKNNDGFWETDGIINGYNNYVMANEARRVLRWGWSA